MSRRTRQPATDLRHATPGDQRRSHGAGAMSAHESPSKGWSTSTICTASGRAVDLLDPDPATISIRDIANHLAKLCRFAGATVVPYSIAQHCVLVADIAYAETRTPAMALHALLHDAHEAYMGDIATPTMTAFGGIATSAIRATARRLDIAIRCALGLPNELPMETARAIHAADQRALVTEARDLLPETDAFATFSVTPWPKRIKAAGWERAEAMFLERFAELDVLSPRASL